MESQTESGNSARGDRVAWPDVNTPHFATSFATFLLAQNAIDDLALQRSLRAATQSGERFDHVLTKLGLVSEADLCSHLSKFLKIPQLGAADMPLEPPLRAEIPEKFIHANRLLPLSLDGQRLKLAVADPLDLEPVRALAYSTGYEIDLLIISPAQFEKAWSALYGARQDGAPVLDNDLRANDASEFDLQRLRDIANEAPLVRRVNQIINEAVESHASDIHIEPSLDAVLVRYRIDGALRTVATLASEVRAAITSRIKIMARLDIAERRLPQDGRIKIAIRGVDIDFRVSTFPPRIGESVVLRILDRTPDRAGFRQAGLRAEDTAQTSQASDAMPNGIILVTGPTGCGKTTTLYTALKELNDPNVKALHRRGPDRISACGRQSGSGATGDRPRLSQCAALHPAPGPGHHHDRRNSRLWRPRASPYKRRSPAISSSRRCIRTAPPLRSPASSTWASRVTLSPPR